MNLVGVESGRLTLLIDLLELGALKGTETAALVAAIRERYGFSIGTPAQNSDPNSVRFEGGHLADGRYITYFEIHPQGLVVQGHTTGVCDAFLADIFDMGQMEFELRRPSALAQTIYMSNVVVEFERSSELWLAKLMPVLDLLNARLNNLYGVKSKADLFRLAFKPDPNTVPGRLASFIPDFILERRVYAPHANERFYSIAPLPTDEHLLLLERIETLV